MTTMKTLTAALLLLLLAVPLRAQFSSGGLQEGAHGSGGTEQAEYSITANPGWNIVSVPVLVSEFATDSLFPSAVTSAFRYQGGYSVADTLQNGEGYWLKFAGGQVIPLEGSVIDLDTVPVAAGWNIVGSVSSPVDAGAITAVGTVIQSSFYAFEGGYASSSTIEPGKGYWVKVSQAGGLVIASGTVPVPPPAPAAADPAKLNSLLVTDAAGNSQRLLFAAGADAAGHELPPPPPEGAFDVRFASQTRVAGTGEEIRLASLQYPVTLAWTLVQQGAYTLVLDQQELPLAGSGSRILTRAPGRLAIGMGAGADLPVEFALLQNYPNPFNPVTEISFAVPLGARTQVLLQVFDVLGREVATLVNEVKEPGRYSVQWDGGNAASGMYYYRLDAGTFTATKKMLLLK